MLLAADGDDRRGQFRQRGAHRHHGQTDDQVVHTQLAGNVHRTPDQQARADDEQHQADQQPDHRPIERHGVHGQFVLHLRAQGIGPLADTLDNGPADQAGEHGEQHHRIGAGQVPVPELIDRQRAHQSEDRQFLAQHPRVHRHRADQRGQAEDQGDVGDVRAVGVAQGDARVALGRGQGADEHLRGRGAEADDEHADEQRRHAEMKGERGRPLDKPVGAPHEQHQTDNNGQSGNEHGDISFLVGLRRPAAGAGGTGRGPGVRGGRTIDTHPAGCKREHRHRPRETRSSTAETTRPQRLRAQTGNRGRPEKDASLRFSIPRARAMLVRSAGRSAPAQAGPGAAPNQQQ